MKRELARELGKLLYGPMVRLHGNGKFERQADGVWKMDDFKVDRYEVLDERSLAETLTLVRTVPNNGLMEPDRYHLVSSLRIGGDEDK
jgi:hypothetical protein